MVLRWWIAAVPEYFGNYLWVEFIHRYTRIFVVSGRTVDECIVDAGFCITFLGRWQQSIKDLPLQPNGQPKVCGWCMGFKILKLWQHISRWLPGCLAAWLPGCLAAWLLGCLVAWLPGCLNYITCAFVSRHVPVASRQPSRPTS